MIFRSILMSCLAVLFVYLPNVDGQPDEFRKAFPEIKEFATPNFEISEPTPLQEETFSMLKEAFAGEMLDKGFTTLQELSKSEKYLAYLGEAHPDVPRFEAFAAFREQGLPPKERYFPFFEASFNFKKVEDITSTDHIAVHILATSFWKSEVRKLHGEDFEDPTVFLDPDVELWLKERDMDIMGREDFTSFQSVLLKLLSLRILVGANQKADATLVKKYFQRDGENNGLLWLAIQDPILFGRILDGFTDIEIFRKWAEGDFYQKQKKRKNLKDDQKASPIK